jgi:hypothetical protein
MKNHNQSFFGQKTGLLLNSADSSEQSIYLRFLKKKGDGTWEKPSNREGKNIKINLLEQIQVIRVLLTVNSKWSTVHKFGEDQTSITVENKNGNVSIYVGGYSKYLKYPETQLLADLLKHIYEEKISNSTGGRKNGEKQTNGGTNNNEIREPMLSEESKSRTTHTPANTNKKNHYISQKPNDNLKQSQEDPQEWYESLMLDDEYRLVEGEVVRTSEKALSFAVKGHKEIWVPLSCQSKVEGNLPQGLWIKDWFLKKKMEEIFELAE